MGRLGRMGGWPGNLLTWSARRCPPDRENLVRSALVRGRVVRRIGGDSGWEIVDRIFAKYTGGPYPRGEEREAFLVEPTHVMVPTFGLTTRSDHCSTGTSTATPR
jgi:hypothetical protein